MADNYTFKDASGNTVTHASKDTGSGVQATRHVEVDEANIAIAKAEDAAHSSGDKGIMALAVRQDTAAALAGTNGDYIPLIVDASGRLYVALNTAAVDDGAAAGELFPAAGLYQATVDEIDDGDLGRLRATKRRAGIVVPDHRLVWAYETTVANAGDIETGTTGPNTGFGAATTAFFTGSDVGFGAAIRYARLPMAHWRAATFWISNQLTTTIALTLDMWLHVIGASAEDPCVKILSTTIPYGHKALLTPHAAGSGSGAADASVICVPAIQSPCAYIVIGITPSADPAGGFWRLMAARS